MEKLLSSLLYSNNILNVRSEDIHLQLLSHQDYPSLKAITDTLDYFSIENIAANVPKDAVYQLPSVFFALIQKKEQVELVLVNRKKEKITLTYHNGEKEKHPVSGFQQMWNGTIIAIEPEEKGKRGFFKKINFTILMIVFVVLSGIINSTMTATLPYVLYTLATLTGIAISYFIVKEQLGINDRVTSKVCSAISKKADSCSTVINSKEGKTIAGIGLADASIIFFSSFFFITQFIGFNNSILYAVSIVTLAVVAVSYYLQAFKLKQWCLLCLLISAVLISQFVILQTIVSNWDFSFKYSLAAGSIIAIVGLVWYIIKRYWKDSIQLKTTLKEYYSFKRNKKFFFQALKDSTSYNLKDLPKRAHISFGANDPKVTIYAVTSPLCGFCKESFEAYAKLLKAYPEDIQVNFIFNVQLDEENKSNQITATFLELYQKNKVQAFKALQDWFNNRDINIWQSTYGMSPLIFTYPKQVIATHNKWCKENNINYTPKTIVNGHAFPKNEYNIEDLQFFIKDLKELQVTDMQTITTV